MSDFCPGCGTEHHWLACPEVRQSVFAGEDPETAAEELVEVIDELHEMPSADELRPLMERRRDALIMVITTAGWDDGSWVMDGFHGTPVGPCGVPKGQGLS